MTATDVLRRMLDERGVEWRKTPHYSSESQDNETVFEGTGIEWCANDHLNGRLGLRTARYEVTPEQAVEATLGVDLKAENAKLREEFDKMDVWHSKELSAAMAEIDKLRELVRDYERCTMHADCAGCEYDGKLSTHCPLSPCFPDADELCELRIEVDE